MWRLFLMDFAGCQFYPVYCLRALMSEVYTFGKASYQGIVRSLWPCHKTQYTPFLDSILEHYNVQFDAFTVYCFNLMFKNVAKECGTKYIVLKMFQILFESNI